MLTVSHGLCRLCADKGHATAAISPRILEVADFFTELLRRSRDGRPVPACELSSRASQLGISHSDLLVGMVQPVLAEIGRLFAAGHVPVHHEHKLSQEVEALLDGFPKPRPAADAKRVLLCLPGGNTHRLGPRLFGQLLAEQGVHADIVAAPAAETILPRLARERYDAVGLSVALPDQVPAAVAIAEAVKASAPGAVTALGGPVTKGPLPESVRVRFDLVDDPSKGPVCAEELVAALRGGPPA